MKPIKLNHDMLKAEQITLRGECYINSLRPKVYESRNQLYEVRVDEYDYKIIRDDSATLTYNKVMGSVEIECHEPSEIGIVLNWDKKGAIIKMYGMRLVIGQNAEGTMVATIHIPD